VTIKTGITSITAFAKAKPVSEEPVHEGVLNCIELMKKKKRGYSK
jgi:hypothetical protein